LQCFFGFLLAPAPKVSHYWNGRRSLALFAEDILCTTSADPCHPGPCRPRVGRAADSARRISSGCPRAARWSRHYHRSTRPTDAAQSRRATGSPRVATWIATAPSAQPVKHRQGTPRSRREHHGVSKDQVGLRGAPLGLRLNTRVATTSAARPCVLRKRSPNDCCGAFVGPRKTPAHFGTLPGRYRVRPSRKSGRVMKADRITTVADPALSQLLEPCRPQRARPVGESVSSAKEGQRHGTLPASRRRAKLGGGWLVALFVAAPLFSRQNSFTPERARGGLPHIPCQTAAGW